MAPIGQYPGAAKQADEIALARSAAPASIADDAEVLTLGSHGYESAAKGKNGFVCMVWRSWTAGFDDPQFWNPKLRAPVCLNAAAVRSVLPGRSRTNEVGSRGGLKDRDARTQLALPSLRTQIHAAGSRCDELHDVEAGIFRETRPAIGIRISCFSLPAPTALPGARI